MLIQRAFAGYGDTIRGRLLPVTVRDGSDERGSGAGRQIPPCRSDDRHPGIGRYKLRSVWIGNVRNTMNFAQGGAQVISLQQTTGTGADYHHMCHTDSS